MAAGSMKVFLEVSSDRPSQVTYFKSTTKKYHTGHFLLRYTTYFTKLKKLIMKNQLYDNMHIVLIKNRLHKYGIIQVYKDGKK